MIESLGLFYFPRRLNINLKYLAIVFLLDMCEQSSIAEVCLTTSTDVVPVLGLLRSFMNLGFVIHIIINLEMIIYNNFDSHLYLRKKADKIIQYHE